MAYAPLRSKRLKEIKTLPMWFSLKLAVLLCDPVCCLSHNNALTYRIIKGKQALLSHDNEMIIL